MIPCFMAGTVGARACNHLPHLSVHLPLSFPHLASPHSTLRPDSSRHYSFAVAPRLGLLRLPSLSPSVSPSAPSTCTLISPAYLEFPSSSSTITSLHLFRCPWTEEVGGLKPIQIPNHCCLYYTCLPACLTYHTSNIHIHHQRPSLSHMIKQPSLPPNKGSLCRRHLEAPGYSF